MIKDLGSDLSQLTIRDISKEAQIAVSQINYHFSSKENLIAICVERLVGEVIALFSSSLAQVENKSSFEKLEYMVNLTFSFLYDNENLSRISIISDYKNPKAEDNTSLTIKAYLPLIEKVCAEKNISEPKLVTQMIVLALQGTFLRSKVLKAEENIDLHNPQQRCEFVSSVLKHYLK